MATVATGRKSLTDAATRWPLILQLSARNLPQPPSKLSNKENPMDLLIILIVLLLLFGGGGGIYWGMGAGWGIGPIGLILLVLVVVFLLGGVRSRRRRL
jgi:hypothetical protein